VAGRSSSTAIFFCGPSSGRRVAAGWPLPLLAALVGYAFAATVWAQWLYRRRPAQLAWALGLTAYSAAAAIEAFAAAYPWNVPLYRAYFTLAAGNVGLLGLGTLLLVASPRAGRVGALVVGAAMLIALFAPWALPLGPDTVVVVDGAPVRLAEAGTDLGGKAIPFSNPGRVAFLLLNVVGGVALIGGALWSWWRTRRPGVLLIGLGALLPFLGGSASTLFGLDARVLLQLLGIVVMFVGFLQGRDARLTADAAAPSPSTAPR
jgi:hypothetical protein